MKLSLVRRLISITLVGLLEALASFLHRHCGLAVCARGTALRVAMNLIRMVSQFRGTKIHAFIVAAMLSCGTIVGGSK